MTRPPVEPPEAPRPRPDPGPALQPRASSPDSFEQNPLNQVADRVSLKATEGLDDEGRVREALRIVIAEGIPINEAARRCHIAPSFLASWREKYLQLLNEDRSVAAQPLMEKGATVKDADLITIPRAAREQFAENWERLVEYTRANPATFHQNPVRVFLENSWLTSWLFTEGQLDRGVFAGAVVAMLVFVLTGSFLMAGRFYRPEEKPVETVLNYDESNQRAAGVALEFFKGSTPEERLPFVRLHEGARQAFDTFFIKHPLPAIHDAKLSKAMPGDGYYLLEFDIPSLGRTHQCVVVEKDGRMLVDWETSSWFQEYNLEELRRTLSRTPVRVAVKVVRDGYYNFGFTEKEYSCYRLNYPGLALDFYAYSRTDSPEDAVLKGLLEPLAGAERQISAILEVRYPQGASVEPNQVQIVRLVTRDWLGD